MSTHIFSVTDIKYLICGISGSRLIQCYTLFWPMFLCLPF